MTLDHATSQRVYDLLKADLLRGLLRRSTSINIAALARQYEVSATPVREALLRLVGERLVDLHQRGGFDVPNYSPEFTEQLLLLRLHLLTLAVDQLKVLPPSLVQRRISKHLGCSFAAATVAQLMDALALASERAALVDLMFLLRDRLCIGGMRSPLDAHAEQACLEELRNAMSVWHVDRLHSVLGTILALQLKRINSMEGTGGSHS